MIQGISMDNNYFTETNAVAFIVFIVNLQIDLLKVLEFKQSVTFLQLFSYVVVSSNLGCDIFHFFEMSK